MARILVVENNDPVRWMLAKVLQFKGHEVEQVSNGRQALNRVAARSYDVILMDVYLPFMDGLEACRRLRQKTRVPILMISTNKDPSLREKAFDSGADAFLNKPLDFEGLMAWVRLACGSETVSTRQAHGVLAS